MQRIQPNIGLGSWTLELIAVTPFGSPCYGINITVVTLAVTVSTFKQRRAAVIRDY